MTPGGSPNAEPKDGAPLIGDYAFGSDCTSAALVDGSGSCACS
jgi:hypothetical protein